MSFEFYRNVRKIKKIFLAWSKKERKFFLLAAGLALLSVLILTVVLIRRATTALPARGGQYTEGLVGQPALVNPILAERETDKSLVRLIFGKLEDLAQQLELEGESQIWKVRLKENLIWSDQEKLTSDDVVFTIQKIQDEEGRSPLAAKWRGVTAERLSELEVRIKVPEPASEFQDRLKNLYLAPKHIFGEVPITNWRISDYTLSPVGSGSYRFVAYLKDRKGWVTDYELNANPDYVGLKPLIEIINFRFYRNEEALVATFNRGQIHGLGGSSRLAWEKIKRPYQKLTFPLPSYTAVFINQARNPALKELVVRKVLDLLAPKEKLVTEILGEGGEATEGPLNRFSNLGVQNESQENQGGAGQLLTESDWRLPDPEETDTEWIPGVRRKMIRGATKNLAVSLTFPDTPGLVETAEKLKAAWEPAGFRVNLTKVASNDLEEVIKNRDYEMLLYENNLDENFDLRPFWHSKERFYPGQNLALYSNSQVDELLDKIRENPASPERRRWLSEVEKKIENDQPAVFLYSPNYVLTATKDLKGVETNLISEPADRFQKISQWYLKTVRVLK